MKSSKNILIIGGAGFIGINAAEYYLSKKWNVVIFDNFSRKGTEKNIAWLKKTAEHKQNLRVVKGDIRYDIRALKKEVTISNFILHLAGQVAVTTSVHYPKEDFEINAGGTLNILEAIRLSKNNPAIIYASTNKVYGDLEYLHIREKKTRYAFKNLPKGIDENTNLDFHSPYGCSKGAADQYVRDYARIYGLNTIVFRQSCIYGEHQFGIEDQGWLAWFVIALCLKKKITIYGTGKQVRDVLYIKDLMEAYDLAYRSLHKTRGKIYNIGGGPRNTISVWHEFVPLLEKLFKRKIKAGFSEVRPGDQPIYVSDIRQAQKDFGWTPRTGVEEGIAKLYDWVSRNRSLFKGF